MDKRPIRLIELFAGIGSQAKALENLGIEYDTVAISEIDRFAIAAYEAIHGKVNNLGDIMNVEALPECDLLTYSFPCQDLSVAGERRGMERESETRSSLLWEVERLLHQYVESGRELPKVLLMENVRGILFKKNIGAFEEWIRVLDGLGYTSSYKLLNSEDYGIPQSRDRCFMVSILGDYRFEFPEPIQLELRLKDMLEDEPDPRFYISDKALAGMKRHKDRHDAKGHGFGFKVTDPKTQCASTIQASAGWRHTDTLIEVGRLDMPHIHTSRVYSTGGFSPTICASEPPKIEDGELKIRRLTPRECWRLMGFTDKDFDKAQEGMSVSRLYILAGNSIVVDVLEAIFAALYIDETYYEIKDLTKF